MPDVLKVFIQSGRRRYYVGDIEQMSSISLQANLNAKLDLKRFEITFFLPEGQSIDIDNGFNWSRIAIKL